jgi:hypothetical protein
MHFLIKTYAVSTVVEVNRAAIVLQSSPQSLSRAMLLQAGAGGQRRDFGV